MGLLESHNTTGSVVDLLARACADHHDVVAATGVGDTITYAQLWARATSLARELVARGVRPEDRVGLWAQQSTELVVGIAGIFAAGAAYVPLDPTLPRSRLDLIIADSSLTKLVAPSRSAGAAGALGLEVISSSRAAGTPDASVALPAVEGHHAAYVIYTSGSTGRPKGVVVEHSSLVRLFEWIRHEAPVRTGDRFVGTASPAFDASVPYLLYPLVTSGTYVALDADTVRDPYLLATELEQVRPRVLLTLPAMLRMLKETGWAGDERLDIWSGGDHCAPDVIQYVVPRVRTLLNWYGPTETTVAVTVTPLRCDDTDSPVGTPAPHVRCHLVAADGTLAAPGATGEVVITGGSLAREYLNDPELTAARFAPLVLEGEGEVRSYRTGDLGRYRADGSLLILGRIDQQINLRGYRVEPGDVEAHLIALPDVLDAVVVPRSSADGDMTLEAFVTASVPLDGAVLREDLRAALPVHMVPAAVHVVDALPLTSTGKVDRQSLLAAVAGDATHAAAPRPAASAAGATDLERDVIGILAEVLGLDPATIGLDEDFFDLGGTSLKSVRLFLLVEERLDAQLPLSTLATSSTPRDLAAAIASAQGTHGVRAPRGEPPRHEWERILNGIWREQLGVGHLSRTDSFFALGGTSEDASRMLEELRSLYGADVALGEFEAAPTIVDLARIVGARSERDVVVPLTSTGTGPPLFLIAGAGGLAITFLPLARLLGADQPCYGLQAQGIERRARPDFTLAAGARRYVRAIREIQPRGPYLLGGHSLGGVHALKVAQLLEAEGEEVGLLAIFDTPLSSAMLGRRVFQATGDDHSTSGVAPKGLPKLKTVLHLPTVGIVRLKGTDQFEVFAALGELQALFAHRLEPWAGPATLFLSDEDEAPVIERRWGRLFTGAWSSAKVPGGHITMLERSNIGVAAAILRDQIDRTLGRSVVPAPTRAPSPRAVGQASRRG